MTRFILTGGTQRQKLLGGIPEWAMYEKAVCAVLDTESGVLKQASPMNHPPVFVRSPGVIFLNPARFMRHIFGWLPRPKC